MGNTDEPLKIQGSLDAYSGEWTRETAAHLLRRTMFGFRIEDLNRALNHSSASDCINDLLTIDEELPSPPVKFFTDNSNDYETEYGETWVGKPVNFQAENERIISLKAWWTGELLNQSFSIREKMTLFWHNHFSTQNRCGKSWQLSIQFIRSL